MAEESYRNRQSICDDYLPDGYSMFLPVCIDAEKEVDLEDKGYNHLVIVLEGEIMAGYNGYSDVLVAKDEMVFFPPYTATRLRALSPSRLMISSFEIPKDVYGVRVMRKLLEMRMEMKFVLIPVRIRPTTRRFLDLLIEYLDDGLKCERLYEIKKIELFLLLMWYYSDQEFVRLFHPVLVKSLDFRASVMKYYIDAGNVAELAAAMGMSRSNFDFKFRKAFGTSPKTWLDQRRVQNIRYYIGKPGVTAKEVMNKYGFNSYTQFNRFCHKHFGQPPSALLKKRGRGKKNKMTASTA